MTTVRRGTKVTYRITAAQADILNTPESGRPARLPRVSAGERLLRVDGVAHGILAFGPVAVADPGEFEVAGGGS